MIKSSGILIFLLIMPIVFIHAQTKVALQYVYADGKVIKEVDASESELVVAYDHRLLTILGLERLHQLKRVELIGLDNFSDIGIFSAVPSLEMIVLDAMVRIDKIDDLFMVSNLTCIIIRGCPGLANESSMKIDLRQTLNIRYLQIADSGLNSPPLFSSIPESLQYLNFQVINLLLFLILSDCRLESGFIYSIILL